MSESRLYLKVPSIDELDYHSRLLADADTMNYNRGYGENGTGCYFPTKAETEQWYWDWACARGHFYAYLMQKDTDTPIGDVCLHYEKASDTYGIGIVIEAKYRGNGYAEEGLRLLADKAFDELGANALSDDFPSDRIPAEKAFQKVGFKRQSADFLLLTKEDYKKTQ